MSKNKRNNSSLASLGELTGRLGYLGNGLPPTPAMWAGNGEDHINIHVSAAKNLTWALMNIKQSVSTSNMNVSHPVIGNFASLDHFWSFVRAARPDDRMRTLPTAKMRQLLDATGGISKERYDNMKALLAEMIYLRLLSFPLNAEQIMESDLPLDMYDATAIMPERDRNAVWMTAMAEEIRKSLKEKRLPNFHGLLCYSYIKEHKIPKGQYSPEMAFAGVIDRWFGGKPPKFDYVKHNTEKLNSFIAWLERKEQKQLDEAVEKEPQDEGFEGFVVSELSNEHLEIEEPSIPPASEAAGEDAPCEVEEVEISGD